MKQEPYFKDDILSNEEDWKSEHQERGKLGLYMSDVIDQKVKSST